MHGVVRGTVHGDEVDSLMSIRVYSIFLYCVDSQLIK